MAADAWVKVDGQRRAIRGHVAKYNEYPLRQDKAFALKTIRNCQGQIQNLKRRQPNIPDSWEDTWTPPQAKHARAAKQIQSTTTCVMHAIVAGYSRRLNMPRLHAYDGPPEFTKPFCLGVTD